MTDSNDLQALVAGFTSPTSIGRQRAVERAAAHLRAAPSKEAIDSIASGFAGLARDEHWEVRAAVAEAAQHLRHGTFDGIVGLLEEDPNSYVQSAAKRSRERRQLAVQATETDLDGIEAVEAQLQRLAMQHSPVVAAEARELALAYLDALVSETKHDAKVFYGVLKDSLGRLERVLTTHDVPSSEWRGPLDDARRRAQVMYATMNDMALYAKTATSAPQRFSAAALVADVVKDVSDHFADRAEKQQVTFRIDIDPTLEVVAPRDLLRRALANVVRNAIEAVPETGRVFIAGDRGQDGRAVLAVVDNGPGIATSQLRRIVLPGVSSKKTAAGSENTGYGLTLAKRIVERHCGGELVLDSAPGEGFTVTFLLQVEQEEPA